MRHIRTLGQTGDGIDTVAAAVEAKVSKVMDVAIEQEVALVEWAEVIEDLLKIEAVDCEELRRFNLKSRALYRLINNLTISVKQAVTGENVPQNVIDDILADMPPLRQPMLIGESVYDRGGMQDARFSCVAGNPRWSDIKAFNFEPTTLKGLGGLGQAAIGARLLAWLSKEAVKRAIFTTAKYVAYGGFALLVLGKIEAIFWGTGAIEAAGAIKAQEDHDRAVAKSDCLTAIQSERAITRDDIVFCREEAKKQVPVTAPPGDVGGLFGGLTKLALGVATVFVIYKGAQYYQSQAPERERAREAAEEAREKRAARAERPPGEPRRATV